MICLPTKNNIPRSGVYVLLLHVRGEESLKAGALGRLDLRDGYYAYVGRAKRIWIKEGRPAGRPS